MELLFTLAAIAFVIYHLARIVDILVHRSGAAPATTPSLDQRDHPTTQPAITEVVMYPEEVGPPKLLLELAAEMANRSFLEVTLSREALMDRPVGWVLTAVSDHPGSERIIICASYSTREAVTARVYRNHQLLPLQGFSSWVDGHQKTPTSTELHSLFVKALNNNWSASIQRHQEGAVTWVNMNAEATPFADPAAEPVTIDLLHNAHTGAEHLSAFRNSEPIDDILAITELNSLAPMSLPTAVFDRTS